MPKPIRQALFILFLILAFTFLGWAKTYSTKFPLTESAMSENGQWQNTAQLTNNFWFGLATQPGIAYNGVGASGFGDVTSLLSGTWGANQTVMAVAKCGTSGSAASEEVEIRLRSAFASQSNRGYEIFGNCGTAGHNGYFTVVRWNGPYGNFNYLTNCEPNCVAANGLQDGDIMFATVSGQGVVGGAAVHIAMYILRGGQWLQPNRTLSSTRTAVVWADDNGQTTYGPGTSHVVWNDGNPGLGEDGFGTTKSDTGWTSMVATDGQLAWSCSQADVSAAVTASSDGQDVVIPNGSCTWASGITLNKQIRLIGQTKGSVLLTLGMAAGGTMLTVNPGTSYSTEIANLNFLPGTGTGDYIFVGGGNISTAKPPIIDNNYFGIPNFQLTDSTGGSVAIDWERYRGGLIHHNTFDSTNMTQPGCGFNCGTQSTVLHMKDVANANTSWTTASTMGTSDTDGTKNVYIEDNTFNNTYKTSIDCDDGMRLVIRHNTFKDSAFGCHMADTSQYGDRHTEVYNNTFIHTLTPSPTYPLNISNGWMDRIGGTGVWTQNVVPLNDSQAYGNKAEMLLIVQNLHRNAGTYACWGTYPAPHQLGQSHNGTTTFTDPFYIWGNTGSAVAGTDYPSTMDYTPDECGRDYITYTTANWEQAGRDYIIGTARPGWVPYTYPHPLQGGTPPPPPPPPPTPVTGLSVAAALGSSNTIVNLTWTQSSDTGIISNKVYRSSTSGGSYSAIFTCTSPCVSYTDSNPLLGSNYYVVTALNSASESSFSNEVLQVIYPARTDKCITGSESGCIAGTTTGMAGAALRFRFGSSDPLPFATLPTAGMNSCFTDPDFGTYECFITDQATQSATTVWDNGDGGGNNWSIDNRLFMAHNRVGTQRFIDVVPSRFKAHTCASSPSSAKCFVVSQITPGTPDSTHVDSSANIAVLRHNTGLPALTLYEHTATKLSRLTVTQPLDGSGTPTGADTISRVTLYDFVAHGLLPSDFVQTWSGSFAVSDGESTALGEGGGGSYQTIYQQIGGSSTPGAPQTVTTEVFIMPVNNVIGGTGGNTFMFQAAAGTTSGTEPNWATDCATKGSTCTDGTVTWTNIGKINGQGPGFWVLEYDPSTGGSLVNTRTGYIRRASGNPDPQGYMVTDDWLTCDRQANVATPGTGTRPCRMKDTFGLHAVTQQADPNYATFGGTQGGGTNTSFPGVGSCVDSGMKLNPSTGSGKWVSGRSYTFHDLVFGSDTNWYIKKSAGTSSSTGDPTTDTTNWQNDNNLCYGYIHEKHTLNVRPLIGMSAPTGVSGGGFSTDAHNVAGYKYTYRGGLYFAHSYSKPTCDAVNNPAGCLYEGAANPGTPLAGSTQCSDSHPTYNNVGTQDFEPVFYPHADVPTWTSNFTCASYSSETAIGSPTVEYRFGTNYNTGSMAYFGGQNATGSINQDGTMLAYASDFMGTRGDASSGASTCANNLRGMYQPTPGKTVTWNDTFSFPNGVNGSPNVYQVTTCGTNTPGATCTLGSPLPDWNASCATSCATGTASVTNLGANTCRSDIAVMDILSAHPALPGVSISPASLVFSSQLVGTTSASQVATLTNAGAAILNISSVVVSGDFARTTTCGLTLAVGASCTITVTFTPTTAGLRSGLITVTDSAAGSPHTATLSGTGIAPQTALSPTSIAFGNQPLATTSTAQTVTVTNTGTAPLHISSTGVTGDFARSTSCGTVAPGATCTISVTFTPTVVGLRSGTLSVTDDSSGSPHTLSLTGTGTAPGATLSPTSLTFAGQLVGTSSTAQTVTLTNSGAATLNISSSTVSGDFSKTTTCGTSLAPGANCTFSIVFSPLATGTRTGTLTVNDDATGSPQTVPLSGTGIAPAASLAPASIDFGNQAVGTTSAGRTVTLSNPGTASLHIASNTISGDFAKTTTCSSTLAAGASCTFTITFTPTVAGSLTGSLTVTDDAADSPQIVSLTGTGVIPIAEVAPSSLDFGATGLGTTTASQSVTLSNTGTATLTIASTAITGDFAKSTTCSSTLAPGATCSFSITFTPTAEGARSGTLTVSDNASGSPHTVALSGTGITPGVSLAPSSLSFGNEVVGTSSATKTVTLTNSGSALLTISSIGISGDFSKTTTCGGTLAVGANCTVTVTFTPTTTGTRAGTLSFTDDAAGSPQTIPLSGTGTLPAASLSVASLGFGNQRVGTTSSGQSVTLTNTGTAPLHIASTSASGDFARTSTCAATLAPNASCTLTVTFTPTTTGARTGTLSITDDASGSPHTVALSGTGTAPAVSLVPNSLSFATQLVGSTSADQTVTLTNTGTATLNIASSLTSGDFAATSTCGATLAVGANCTFSLSFTPTTSGARSGTLTITDDASGSPHTVSLSGTGAAPAPQASLSPSSLTFGPQLVGTSSSTQTVTLSNPGTGTLTIASIIAAGDYSRTTTCGATLAAAADCSITVTFTPTAAGSRSGSITITDDALSSPQVVSLSGTGQLVVPSTASMTLKGNLTIKGNASLGNKVGP